MTQNSNRILESPEGDFHLRRLEMRDAGQYFTVFEANREYITRHDPTFADVFQSLPAVQKELALFNAPYRHNFGVIRDGEMTGSVGMHLKPSHEGTIFYWMDRHYAGQGLASRAGLLLTQYAFREMFVQEMRAVIADTNVASQRVAEKIGFSFERKVDDELHFSLPAQSL